MIDAFDEFGFPFGAIGKGGIVAGKEEFAAGQMLPDRSQHAQPAYAGIEDQNFRGFAHSAAFYRRLRVIGVAVALVLGMAVTEAYGRQGLWT